MLLYSAIFTTNIHSLQRVTHYPFLPLHFSGHFPIFSKHSIKYTNLSTWPSFSTFMNNFQSSIPLSLTNTNTLVFDTLILRFLLLVALYYRTFATKHLCPQPKTQLHLHTKVYILFCPRSTPIQYHYKYSLYRCLFIH